MSDYKLKLFSFSGNIRTLHLTWFAFFISFFVWFNHAPLMASIQETFGLSTQEVKALLIMNVALTCIPACCLFPASYASFLHWLTPT